MSDILKVAIFLLGDPAVWIICVIYGLMVRSYFKALLIPFIIFTCWTVYVSAGLKMDAWAYLFGCYLAIMISTAIVQFLRALWKKLIK